MKNKVITAIKVLVVIDLLIFFISFLMQWVLPILGPLAPFAAIALGVRFLWKNKKRTKQ